MSMQTDPQPIRDVRWESGQVVIAVEGDIDLRRAKAFQDHLLAVLDREPRRIVVDLSGVPYMDSSGVASLVKLLSRCRRQDVELHLVRLTARVRSIFEITRLDTVFEIFDDVQASQE